MTPLYHLGNVDSDMTDTETLETPESLLRNCAHSEMRPLDKASVLRETQQHPLGWINVRTASIRMSSLLQSPCPSCIQEAALYQSCRESNVGSFCMASASADGDFMMFALIAEERGDMLVQSVGLLILFDLSAYSTIDDSGPAIRFEMQKVAPLRVVTIEVTPYLQVTDIGMLHVCDAWSSIDDSRYLRIGAQAPTGTYDVVAWFGETMLGNIAPVAATVTGSSLRPLLTNDIALMTEPPVAECLTAAQGPSNGDVLHALNDHLVADAQRNFEPWTRLGCPYPYPQSWAMQCDTLTGMERLLGKMLATSNESDVHERLSIPLGLHIRGLQEASLNALAQLEKAFESQFTTDNHAFAERLRSSPPGSLL